MTKAFEILGIPQGRGVLIVADHAGNAVPDDINLGIDPEYLNDHIAYDIGTAEVAQIMTEKSGNMAILGTMSRLVVDLNRYAHEPAIIPLSSDGIAITANDIDDEEREKRISRYYTPYHERVGELVKSLQPAIVLSLHSFTPKLRSNPDLERPWDMGVLYNDYETASKMAVQYLEQEGLNVGDQKPYSGKDLNATMNQHCESVGQPYLGIEIRQDLIADEAGQRKFAEILLRICDKIRTGLA